jgi:hypothetical protein
LKQLLIAGAWREAAAVSILVMLSQHSHHFCNYAICFQTIAKIAKMMRGL